MYLDGVVFDDLTLGIMDDIGLILQRLRQDIIEGGGRRGG